MATPMSRHALILPAGGAASNRNQSANTIQVKRIDDYLSQRHEFWKKDPSSCKSKIFEDNNPAVADQGIINEEITSLRRVSSQIEIAMTLCCEKFPNHLDAPHSSNRRAVPTKNSTKDASETTKMGILRAGTEGHFLKLLSMYCPKHTVGNRALAIAILHRTAEWENCDSPIKSVSTAGFPEATNEQRAYSTDGFLSANCKANSTFHSTRIKSFLAIGMTVFSFPSFAIFPMII